MSLLTHLSLAAAIAWLPVLTDGDEFPAKLQRPVIGVTTSVPGPTLAAQLRLADGTGLVIDEVLPGKPAEAAGLEAHDLIVAIDGREPIELADLREAVLRHHEAGDSLALVVLRGGERLKLSVGVVNQELLPEARPLGDFWGQLVRADDASEELAYARLLERSNMERLVAEKSALASRSSELERARASELDKLRLAELLAKEGAELPALKRNEALRREAEAQAQLLAKAAAPNQAEVAKAKQLMAKLEAELAQRQAEVVQRQAEAAERVAAMEAKLKQAKLAQTDQSQSQDSLSKLLEAYTTSARFPHDMAIVGDGGDVDAKRLFFERSLASGKHLPASSDLDPRLASIEKRLAHIESLMKELVESVR